MHLFLLLLLLLLLLFCHVCGFLDLSFLTRFQTHALSSESWGSEPLDHQRITHQFLNYITGYVKHLILFSTFSANSLNVSMAICWCIPCCCMYIYCCVHTSNTLLNSTSCPIMCIHSILPIAFPSDRQTLTNYIAINNIVYVLLWTCIPGICTQELYCWNTGCVYT